MTSRIRIRYSQDFVNYVYSSQLQLISVFTFGTWFHKDSYLRNKRFKKQYTRGTSSVVSL